MLRHCPAKNAMNAIQRKYKGFSLVELLSVVAITVIMTSLLLPAISSFSSTAGRRGAVNSLMNVFEQARVSALETGCDVYVVMRLNREVGGQDSFLVARKRADEMGDPPSPAYVIMSKWQKLPKGVFFFPANSTLTSAGSSLPSDLVSSLPGSTPSNDLFGIGFNNYGQVSFPGISAGGLSLYLAEAIRSGSVNARKGASLSISERLSFRRYTGRAQLDYAAPPQG